MSAFSASARSQTCSVKIELLNARKSVAVGLIDFDGLPECHVVERDSGALVDRPVGALLQRDLVDRSAHARKRQRQHTREVAGVEATAVHRAGALLAGREDAVAIGGVDPRRVEQKCRRDNVFPAFQQSANVIEMRGARGVEDAVGVQLQDLLDVGGRGHADRLAADERADVDTVLRLGVDQRADEVEIVAVVEDGGDDLAAHRAGAPLNNPIHARTVAAQGRRRVSIVTSSFYGAGSVR